MFLSIIIPAYNESSIIEDTLNKVNSFLSSKDFKLGMSGNVFD